MFDTVNVNTTLCSENQSTLIKYKTAANKLQPTYLGSSLLEYFSKYHELCEQFSERKKTAKLERT